MSDLRETHRPNLNFSRESTQGRAAPTVAKHVRSKPLCTYQIGMQRV
jgi:hypothetical protein